MSRGLKTVPASATAPPHHHCLVRDWELGQSQLNSRAFRLPEFLADVSRQSQPHLPAIRLQLDLSPRNLDGLRVVLKNTRTRISPTIFIRAEPLMLALPSRVQVSRAVLGEYCFFNRQRRPVRVLVGRQVGKTSLSETVLDGWQPDPQVAPIAFTVADWLRWWGEVLRRRSTIKIAIFIFDCLDYPADDWPTLREIFWRRRGSALALAALQAGLPVPQLATLYV